MSASGKSSRSSSHWAVCVRVYRLPQPSPSPFDLKKKKEKGEKPVEFIEANLFIIFYASRWIRLKKERRKKWTNERTNQLNAKTNDAFHQIFIHVMINAEFRSAAAAAAVRRMKRNAKHSNIYQCVFPFFPSRLFSFSLLIYLFPGADFGPFFCNPITSFQRPFKQKVVAYWNMRRVLLLPNSLHQLLLMTSSIHASFKSKVVVLLARECAPQEAAAIIDVTINDKCRLNYQQQRGRWTTIYLCMHARTRVCVFDDYI